MKSQGKKIHVLRQGSWCIASPSASDEALMDNINFVCQEVDCSIIQQGGDCFYPATSVNHASVVMNLYYQKLGKHHWNCDFKKTGVLTVTDPSKHFYSTYICRTKLQNTPLKCDTYMFLSCTVVTCSFWFFLKVLGTAGSNARTRISKCHCLRIRIKQIAIYISKSFCID